MTTDTVVHVVVEGFTAITEFPPERKDIHDACGPDAEETCLASCEHRQPTTGNIIAIRSRGIETGRFRVGGGQNLDQLEADVAAHTTIKTTKTPMGSHIEVIHQALRDAMMRGNPCVLNLALAGALPGNEAGIHYHFVAVGGINTNLGYLIANGDEVPFGHVGAYWVKWDPGIFQAQPYGLLEFHMPAPTPPQPPTDDQKRIEELTAELAQAHAKIQAAEKALTA